MFSATVYSMNREGKMEVNHGKPVLPIGSKVFTYGSGMSECDAIVISEPDERGSQKCVTTSNYEDSRRFFSIDSYSKPISKKFGIGCYYDDSLEVVYCAEDIAIAIELATTAQDNRNAKAKAESEAYAAEKAALPAKYPHLKPLADGQRYDKAARKFNLVGQLQHTFPNVKFSVRNDHGSTYNIRWENGPTDKEVTAVLNLFKDSYFDGMTDSTVHYSNAFSSVFGSFDYLFTHRNWSAELQEMWEGNKHLMGNGDRDWFNEAFRKQSFPAYAKITGYDDDNNVFNFTAPEATTTASSEPITRDGVTIEDYSEKAIVVRGITKDDKDTHAKFREIGGVFNFKLKGGAGWIFSKRKTDDVKNALGL